MEFEDELHLLNTLYIHPSIFHCEWESVLAAKDHIDEFGQEIKKGTFYYMRNMGYGHFDVFRLSEDSFSVLLAILFHKNKTLAEWAKGRADEIERARHKELAEAACLLDKPLVNNEKNSEKEGP